MGVGVRVVGVREGVRFSRRSFLASLQFRNLQTSTYSGQMEKRLPLLATLRCPRDTISCNTLLAWLCSGEVRPELIRIYLHPHTSQQNYSSFASF